MSGGKDRRYNPRRLFSFDNLKSHPTRAAEAVDLQPERDQYRRDNAQLGEVDEGILRADPFINDAREHGLAQPRPRFDADGNGVLLGPDKPPAIVRPESSLLASQDPSRSSTPDTISLTDSVPRARWDFLRQQVLLSPATPQPPTAPLVSPVRSQTPTPRSNTPKPSRFARLGFRHVVEQAKDSVEDSIFHSNEVLKACWNSRYTDHPKTKGERDNLTLTMGSSLNLSFMSNATLASAGSQATGTPYGNVRKHEASGSQMALSASFPTLKPLWQLLMSYTIPSPDGILHFAVLPHESLVLSILLGPFLSPDRNDWIEEERLISMISFEAVVKTWFPANESSFVNHCLWCCRAAMIPPSSLRLRALYSLHSLLAPRDTKMISTPAAFQSVACGLLNLLAVSSTQSMYSSDTDGTRNIRDSLTFLRSGACVAFNSKAVDEQYGAAVSQKGLGVCDFLLAESLAKCIESTTGRTRAWLIQYVSSEGWVSLPVESALDPLSTVLHTRKLISLSRSLIYALPLDGLDHGTIDANLHLLLDLFQVKILTEIDFIGTQATTEVVKHVARLALHLIALELPSFVREWAASMIDDWYRRSNDWKLAFDVVLEKMVNNEPWKTILTILGSLFNLVHDPTRQGIFAFVLPLLSQRLAEDPPPYPCVELSNLLGQISKQYPPLFYKPLFVCAASSKEYLIMNYLCTFTAVTKFLPSYWISDAEMISVALISDVSKKKRMGFARTDTLAFDAAQLGQLVLFIEVIGQIQAARHRKQELSNADGALLDIIKFVMGLESRLSVLLVAREKGSLYPFSHRVLYCILFREIRLLTRSSKPAPWLSKVVAWLVEYHKEELTNDEELDTTISQLQGLYEAARNGSHSGGKRRSTMFLAAHDTHLDASDEQQKHDVFESLSNRLQVLKSAGKGFIAKSMKLLVLMSTLLTTEDFVRLGPVIWERGFNESIPSAISSSCYLMMQCAEKTSREFLTIIEIDLKSSDGPTRLSALEKLSVLCNWRFQLASLQVIVDRSHRPFKMARGPLPFVATDMGSSSYIPEESHEQGQSSVPLELRKRLAEIGWSQEDTTVDPQQEWVKTPMLLLPAHHFSCLESSTSEQTPFAPLSANTSPKITPQESSSTLAADRAADQQLLRRSSSSGGPIYHVKRRALFVATLTLVFPTVASLALDSDNTIASTARNIILDLMRNEPTLLSRPLLDLLSGEKKDIPSAMTTLNLYLHSHQAIPPPMAHHIFNNLAGYLKFGARQIDGIDLVDDLARIIPLLAGLITQVSGMSMREIRRSKLELFFIPTGTFWFTQPTPNESMFPSGPKQLRNPFEDTTMILVSVTLIRVCQNMMFLDMLRKNARDVHFIRKHMSRLELPSLHESLQPSNLELRDFLPSNQRGTKKANETVKALSMMLSHSYLLLVAQIFRSMSRHLSDRSELALFIDGLNYILLSHGTDIGIVSQTLITLMVASTRFRRLFMSGGAYMLFMPAILKIYSESERHPGIRLAIEYAIDRFYALHQDAFIFQSLDAISRLATLPDIDGEKLGKSVFDLFASLRQGISPTTPDAAGIHDVNKMQEREALLVNTAEEKPQTFLASVKHESVESGGQIAFAIPEEYRTARLRISDFIRLFLTIVAHDVSTVRAENFLALFRLVAPYAFEVSKTGRSVLIEGIDALGVILSKSGVRTKTANAERDDSVLTEWPMQKQMPENSKQNSDILRMRLDYLSLLVSSSRAGGLITHSTVTRAIDMAKGILKDTHDFNDRISAFFADFTEASLLRDNPPSAKEVVAYLQSLAPVISTYGAALDFNRVFVALTKLAAMPNYANEVAFSKTLCFQICSAALVACASASTEKLIMSLPYRSSLVSLLAQTALLRDTNVAAELEKHAPTYDYLAGIILPFVMVLKTGSVLLSLGNGRDSWQYTAVIRVWVCLLKYSMSACQNNHRSLSFDVNKRSGDKRRSMETTDSNQVPIFMAALQVIKAILIRAGDDLSADFPGMWNRMAMFFDTVLIDGSAEFALQLPDQSVPSSPTGSPVGTPRSSLQFDPSPRPSFRTDFGHPSIFERSYLSPRVVDYVMWSVFELLCSYRNPLLLHLRLLIVEKMLDLDQVLRSQQHALQLSSPNVSGGSRRTSISAFSKPLRRTSAAPTPSLSPRLVQAQEPTQNPSFLTVSDNRKPGYQYQSSTPASPQELRPGPRIVHLGPASASLLRPAVSPGGTGGMSLITRSAKVKSLPLIRATYQRIRIVQTYMGYQNILPLPYHESTDVDRDEVMLSSWTKYQALEAIKSEMGELLEEFEEVYRYTHDDTVIIEPEHYPPSV
ncbi:hypothetical protein AX17_003178 [Amanita inopinata Kibby_2008]|nr:hypothetical protein AX17_003178 [Amanita inopinata Kibby_2008]